MSHPIIYVSTQTPKDVMVGLLNVMKRAGDESQLTVSCMRKMYIYLTTNLRESTVKFKPLSPDGSTDGPTDGPSDDSPHCSPHGSPRDSSHGSSDGSDNGPDNESAGRILCQSNVQEGDTLVPETPPKYVPSDVPDNVNLSFYGPDDDDTDEDDTLPQMVPEAYGDRGLQTKSNSIPKPVPDNVNLSFYAADYDEIHEDNLIPQVVPSSIPRSAPTPSRDVTTSFHGSRDSDSHLRTPKRNQSFMKASPPDSEGNAEDDTEEEEPKPYNRRWSIENFLSILKSPGKLLSSNAPDDEGNVSGDTDEGTPPPTRPPVNLPTIFVTNKDEDTEFEIDLERSIDGVPGVKHQPRHKKKQPRRSSLRKVSRYSSGSENSSSIKTAEKSGKSPKRTLFRSKDDASPSKNVDRLTPKNTIITTPKKSDASPRKRVRFQGEPDEESEEEQQPDQGANKRPKTDHNS